MRRAKAAVFVAPGATLPTVAALPAAMTELQYRPVATIIEQGRPRGQRVVAFVLLQAAKAMSRTCPPAPLQPLPPPPPQTRQRGPVGAALPLPGRAQSASCKHCGKGIDDRAAPTLRGHHRHRFHPGCHRTWLSQRGRAFPGASQWDLSGLPADEQAQTATKLDNLAAVTPQQRREPPRAGSAECLCGA